MRPLLSPEQMRRADERCIAAGTSAETLMERAGRAVARRAIEMLGGRYGSRVAVVCGKGNNGGDGFVAARVLANEGVTVRCFLVVSRAEVQGPAGTRLAALERSGIGLSPFNPEALEAFGPDLVIDALFGTGFAGAVEGAAAEAISAMNEAPYVLAVDIPSGVNGTTGACEGPCVDADVTVAIAAEKWGTSQPPGSTKAGVVEVVDIGIPMGRDGAEVSMVEGVDVAAMLPARRADTHKRSAGSVALLAGSDAMPGAASLSGAGAIRMGAGYVSLGTTGEARRVATEVVPEMLCTELTEDAQLDGASIERFRDVLERADCVAAGPGLGRGDGPSELVRRLLDEVNVPLILDADALNALSDDLAGIAARTAPTVLTPHPGELGSLMGRSASDINGDRLGVALEAAGRLGGAVLLLKGQRTVVAAGGRAYVIRSGGPELATAGTGDVLTGAIAALCAAGLDPLEAAIAGAHVHGIAGALAGKDAGRAGVMARDVARELGRASDLVTGSHPGPDLL